MKRRARWILSICSLLVLLFLACRLLLVALQTETGLQTLSLSWWDATCGAVLGKHEPIYSQEPAIQAEYWLAESDRVLEAHGDNAQITMGAALALDNPGTAYYGRYLKNYKRFTETISFPNVDYESLGRAIDLFESKCADRCLQLAARATELDPENPKWWRLRALLLMRYSTFFSYDSPRDPKWLEILDECSRHDTDNALYDYLAASFYWKDSASIDFTDDNDRLVIKDVERFNQGVSRFARGQEKPYFALGDSGIAAVADFLFCTRAPLVEHQEIIESRGIERRFSESLRDLWRFERARAFKAAQVGELDSALSLCRQNLHFIDQYTNASDSMTYDPLAMSLRVTIYQQIRELASEHQDFLSAEESKEFYNLEKDARLTDKVVEEAYDKLDEGRSTSLPRNGMATASKSAMSSSVFIVGLSPPFIITLLLVGFISVTICLFGKSSDLPKIGPAGIVLSFIAALLLSFVVFGLAPSKIIGPTLQAWALTILLIAVPMILAFWIAWHWLWRRDFRATFRAAFVSLCVICALYGIAQVTKQNPESFVQIPFDLSISPCGWQGWRAEVLEHAIRPLGSWVWAVCQWEAYWGQYLTVLLWVIFVAIMFHVKTKRAKPNDDGPPVTFRSRIVAVARSLGKPSLIGAGLMLLVYLALAPSVVTMAEEDYQMRMESVRESSSYWEKLDAAIEEVRADKQLMLKLEKRVKNEMPEDSSSLSG